ncbi:MAG: PaaI family thioesterase, partial [Gemmatimonadota bacterium]|nr:PaaI family thioesterase [Gemmatimonadota bacterium]
MSDPERIEPGPFSAHLGFRLVRVDEDGAHVEADPAPEHLNGGGIVHGGYLSALLDTTTGWAVHAQVPPGVAAPHV